MKNKKLLVAALLIMVSCEDKTSLVVTESPKPSPTPSVTPTLVAPSPTPSPSPVFSPVIVNYPLKGWQDEYTKVLIDYFISMEGMDLSSMKSLCPKWDLVNQQKVWVKLWQAIAYCESSHKRTAWMEEKMGKDPVTGVTVKSEGLLQLSYQDVKNYKTKECYQISWEKDKGKDQNDPTKTIFHPIYNLECGMSIAKRQLGLYPKGHDQWGTALGRYWSCARPLGRGIKKFKEDAKECF